MPSDATDPVRDAGRTALLDTQLDAGRPVREAAAFRIGSVTVDPPILQAPMAGFTNYAFRRIVRQFGGVGLQATEMVNARRFAWRDARAAEHPDRLWGVRDEPRPLAVQIWDNDADIMARVARRLVDEYQISVVDINFGCPVRKVTEKARSGSYLLRFPDRIGRIVERVVHACDPVPVTAKIRLGCTRDTINACEVARVIEQSGAAALTVHGRTAEDFFRGKADWHQIARIKDHLQKIPLIGNGDLDSAESAVGAYRQCAVDGIMIGRAALGRPWIFRQVAAGLRGDPVPPDPSLEDQRALLLEHHRHAIDRFGPTRATFLMRKYACSYAQGIRGARLFRTHAAQVTTPDGFVAVVDAYFPRDGSAPSVRPDLHTT
ncbi:MAG: tRNA dihydrouridine synthase DusB [Planctomycetes bacterium]|nr:tRNA dihydrouridine synthase DusB [Planctomycetota bacterium]